jgi:iron(III) transport system substrate-binding protein
MKKRASIIFGLLALIVALPLGLRRETSMGDIRNADDRLVILTPHNESIRAEFEEAFAKWWKARTKRSVHIDWRTPGGTSEIRMVLDAGFKAAEETGREGIGVDLFFGGGEPDFASQAKKERFAPLRVFHSNPELFTDDGPIPSTFTGERYHPQAKDWVGTCLSQFGICYNPDALTRIGISPPLAWRDLGAPRYAGSLALADPTKSGSVARTFELIIQGEMQRRMREQPDDADAKSEGWDEGLRLIQRISANSRYFTDSASKIPHDVAQGNAAAGMCIDFYGRSYASELSTSDGRPRIVWIAPEQGTTLSCDPVAVLKGAPSPETAQAFVEFCLTKEAQRLWFARPGTTDGPIRRALHRLPIRRDIYTTEAMATSTLESGNPYEDTGNFIYQKELTGSCFNTLRQLVKVMCIDSHEEMKEAWALMAAAGMPKDALTVFHDVSRASYVIAGKGDPRFDKASPLEVAEYSSELGQWFRENYRKAAELSRQHLATQTRNSHP